MKHESILEFLENKTILVTGATGFLAKVFVEKILRFQPNVKKLYLLLRAPDSKSANKRMREEVIGKELFRILKEKCGENFDSLISEKVVAVAGDIIYSNLGVRDFNLRDEMWKEIDVVINSAATTDFYERYDISLDVNTLGPLNVLNFTKKCIKLKMLLHVSTAYVCGEGEGLIKEDPIYMGDTMKPTCSKLDPKAERKLAQEKLYELQAHDLSKEDISATMKEFGMKRAKLFGWPNTYVFTKAMGEMCLRQSSNDNIPLVIIRPTMVTSTYKEPFPGWIEGLRTIDSVIVGYGKGRLSCFLASPSMVLDLIPVDMVVNAMVVAMSANVDQLSTSIYHVGSSLRNPINSTMLRNFSFSYFINNPLINKIDNKPVEISKGIVLPNLAVFKIVMLIRFFLPLMILQLLNIAFGHQYFRNLHAKSKRKTDLVMRLVELYKPYLLFKGIFDDMNSEKLWLKATESCMEVDEFSFDTKSIDWEDYMVNSHIPGLRKYVIKN